MSVNEDNDRPYHSQNQVKRWSMLEQYSAIPNYGYHLKWVWPTKQRNINDVYTYELSLWVALHHLWIQLAQNGDNHLMKCLKQECRDHDETLLSDNSTDALQPTHVTSYTFPSFTFKLLSAFSTELWNKTVHSPTNLH